MNLEWIIFYCMVPTLFQGVIFSLPLLVSGLLLRVLVRQWTRMNLLVVNILASAIGLWVLWWYYGGGVVYFISLCGIIYGELVLLRHHRGAIIGFTSVMFLIVWYIIACALLSASCIIYLNDHIYSEGLVAPATNWHQVRGTLS